MDARKMASLPPGTGITSRRYRRMAYALFSEDKQISRSFSTEAEVWDHADSAGLVEYVEKDGKQERYLEDKFKVQKVKADAA